MGVFCTSPPGLGPWSWVIAGDPRLAQLNFTPEKQDCGESDRHGRSTPPSGEWNLKEGDPEAKHTFWVVHLSARVPWGIFSEEGVWLPQARGEQGAEVGRLRHVPEQPFQSGAGTQHVLESEAGPVDRGIAQRAENRKPPPGFLAASGLS